MWHPRSVYLSRMTVTPSDVQSNCYHSVMSDLDFFTVGI